MAKVYLTSLFKKTLRKNSSKVLLSDVIYINRKRKVPKTDGSTRNMSDVEQFNDDVLCVRPP